MSHNIDRRQFMQITGVTGIGALSGLGAPSISEAAKVDKKDIAQGPLIRDVMKILDSGEKGNIMPVPRSEILENPKAVFIIKTSVKTQKDAKGSFDEAGPQIVDAGYDTVKAIFEKGSEKGGKSSINPNWTHIPNNLRYPTIGVTTSPHYIAGFAEGLRELGNTNFAVSERSSGANMLADAGHLDILSEHNIPFIDGKYGHFSMYEKKELNWHKIKDGVVWKRVPTFRPHFDDDTYTINMPTMKCHNLGLTTLSIKNMQGFIPTGYGHYCDQWHQVYNTRPEMRKDINDDFWQNIEESFLRHREMGYKYYDYEDSYKLYRQKGGWDAFRKVRRDRKKADTFMKGVKNPMWDEQWAQRTVDTLSALKPDINIVEGVISRDGNAFENGTDYLSNYIIVSLDLVAVDAVTSYLMGHDPKEIHYLRIADERGYGPVDIAKIPLYAIDGTTVSPINDFKTLKRYTLGVDLHRTPKTSLKFY